MGWPLVMHEKASTTPDRMKWLRRSGLTDVKAELMDNRALMS
jgi:hypothetical protein